MPINVLDFESMIRGYMVNKIKEKYPQIDTSPNSSFDDLFIKPMSAIIVPFVDTINNTELKMNLSNAKYMTETDLDEIGESNFLISRNKGERAQTTVTLSFTNVPTDRNLVIPPGLIFETESALQYQTVVSKEFTPKELITMYNPDKMLYEVDVLVEAADVGAMYNVAENQITKCPIYFNANLMSITNKNAVSSGIDKESNEDYAVRIREFYVSRHLGTIPGYTQFIYENFDEVEGVYVAGYGDPFMLRDEITIIDPITRLETTTHIGGKVDIYVKGSVYDTETVTVNLNSNYLVLGQSNSQIMTGSINITNVTDGTKIPTISDILNIDGKCIVKLNNTANHSYDPSIVSRISITYDYKDSGDNTVTHTQTDTFRVGLTEFELSTPLKDIVAVQDTVTGIFYSASNYSINRAGDIGTSRETALMTLVNMDSVANGTPIKVTYSINRTIKLINDVFDIEENRVVTTDVVIKEAEPVFVNIQFTIKMKDGQKFDDVKNNYIMNSLNNFFETAGMGEEIQESDIVGWIYKDESLTAFIDYISLPFTSFYVAEDPSLPMEVKRDGTKLAINKVSYPILNKIIITAI